MSDSVLKIILKAVGGPEAAGEIRKVSTATDQMAGAVRASATAQQQSAESMRASTAGAGALTSAMGGLAAAFSAAAILKFSREIATAKDEMAAMRQQALMMSGSSAGFEALYASAQRMGVGIRDASQAVNFFAPALAKLGKSYEQSIEFSENLTKSMQVYGLQGQAAASVTTQLSQALSSGTLGGDELKSLRENAGGLAMKLEEAIQKVLGTKDSLKDLGTQGRLSSEVVSTAWEMVFKQLKEQIANLPETLAKQDARMGNAAGLLMEALDKRLHSSDIWQWFERGLTEQMERMTKSITPMDFGPLTRVKELNDEIDRLKAQNREFEASSGYSRSATATAEYQGRLADIAVLEKQRSDAVKEYATNMQIAIALDERSITNKREQIKLDSDAAGAAKAWADSKISSNQVEAAFGAQARATIETMLPAITAMSEKYNVSEAAIIAMMKAESNFNQQAMSGKGAVGVMQMTAVAAEQVAAKTGLSFAQMKDGWKANIEGGTAYMRWLLDNSNGAIKNVDDLARAYNAGLGGMNKGFAETEKHGDRVSAAYEKLTLSGKSATDIMGDNTKAADKQADAHKKAATEAEKLAIAQAQVNLAGEQGRIKIEEYLAEQEKQLAVAGLSREEQIRAAEQHKINGWAMEFEQKAATAAAAGHLELAAAHRKSAEDTRAGTQAAQDHAVALDKVKVAAKAAAPTIADLWNSTVLEMSKNIQNSLADAFTSLFDGSIKKASSFIDALKKVVIRGLANLASAILMNPINVVINATMVGASGEGQAGQQGSTTVQSAYGSGSSSGLSSVSSMVNGTKIGTSAVSAINYLHAGAASDAYSGAAISIANTPNWAYGVGSIAGSLLGNAVFKGKGYSSIGSSLGSLGGSIAGAAVAGASAGAAGAAAGAAAGSVVPIIGTIVGGVIGGLSGGALGSLFGKEKKKMTEEIIYMQQKDGYIQVAHQANSTAETIGKVEQAALQLNTMTATLADTLGTEATIARNNITLGEQPLYPQDVEKYLRQQTTATINAMLEASTGTARDMITKAWQETGYDVDKMQSIVAGVKQIMDNLPEITKALTDAGVNLGDDAEKATLQMMTMAGGMDNLIASQNAYQKLFVGPEEAAKNQADALSSEFARLGMTLPATRADLRAWMDSLDMTDQNLVSSRLIVLGMADALDQYYGAAESAAAATGDLSTTIDGMVASITDSAAELESAKAKYAGLFIGPGEALDNTIASITSEFTALDIAVPATRSELRAIVDGFDLTTESGRRSYIAVMGMSDGLDSMYTAIEGTAAAIDSFVAVQKEYYDTFTTEEQKAADTLATVTAAFVALGLTLPGTREELVAMIAGLSEAEQRALAANAGIVAQLNSVYAAQEAAATKAAQEQADAAAKAAAAQEEAQRKVDEAQAEATRKAQEAAQEALQKITAIVSSLQSAISGFRLEKDALDQATFKTSQSQLVAWAASGKLPEQEALDKSLGGLSSFSKSSYATQADYARDYWVTMNALTTLEKRAVKQQTAAERMVNGVESQLSLSTEWFGVETDWLQRIVGAVDGLAKAQGFTGSAAATPTGESPVYTAPVAQPTQVGTADNTAALIAEIREWREAQRVQAVDMALYQKRSADTLRKWDDEGLPDNRDGVTLLRTA